MESFKSFIQCSTEKTREKRTGPTFETSPGGDLCEERERGSSANMTTETEGRRLLAQHGVLSSLDDGELPGSVICTVMDGPYQRD